MSAILSACCQSCETGSCFWGATSGDQACRLNKFDRLWLKVQRPSHTHTERHFWSGSACPCDGERYDLVKTCSGKSPLVAAFRHYRNPLSGGSADYPFYYIGPSDVESLWPSCSSPCCGYSNDSQCCSEGNLCSSYRTPSGYCSERQREAIRTGVVASTNVGNVEECDYGNSYAWLKDIAANSYGSQFQNYDSDGQPSGTTHLAGALLMVVHREMHWSRPIGGCTEDVLPLPSEEPAIDWSCRIPNIIGFGCSGCPVFAFEIMNSTLSPSLTGLVDRDDLVASIHDGEPLSEAVAQALIDDGVLNMKVYSGHDKPIEKRIIGTGPRAVDTTIEMYARPGGWFWICSGFHGSDSDDVLDQYWPQVARGFDEDCSIGGIQQCWTAAPTPQDCSCSAIGSQWCPNSGATGNPCDATEYGNCDVPLAPLCDEDTCVQDVYNAYTSGIAWKHLEYAQGAGTTISLGTIDCVLDNNAMWWIQPAYESGGGSSACEAEVCPINFDHTTIPPVRHYMPELVSQNIRNDNQTLADVCCGADGLFSVGSLVFCPAEEPHASACDQFNPGRPMGFEEPTPGTGCGRHPCEDQALGRCYNPLGTGVVYDVTEAECDKCGWTWDGQDTC